MRPPILFIILLLSSHKITAQVIADNQLNCRIEPSMEVQLSSPVVGIIEEVLVDKNAQVERGQVVARLEDDLETATVALRKALAKQTSQIEAQQLQFNFTKRSLKRVNDLYKKKAASYAELDKAKTEHAIAAQQLQQAKDQKQRAQLEYRRSEVDLARRTITTPISGTVVERFKQPGEHIDFEPVLKIVHLNPLKVTAYGPASLFGEIKIGMKARVSPILGNKKHTHQAEVTMVDPVIDGASGTIGIELSLKNPDNRIPSGLKCTISFPGVSLNLLDR